MRKRVLRTIAGREIPAACLTPIETHVVIQNRISELFCLSDSERAWLQDAVTAAIESERLSRINLLAGAMGLDLDSPSGARRLAILLANDAPLPGFAVDSEKGHHRVGRPKGSQQYDTNLWLARLYLMATQKLTSREACIQLSVQGKCAVLKPKPGSPPWRRVPPRTLEAAAERIDSFLASPRPPNRILLVINETLREILAARGPKASHEN